MPGRRGPQTAWTPDRRAELERLWTAGTLTAEGIAAAMGLPSRNVVIGQAHRMGLPAKRRGPRLLAEPVTENRWGKIPPRDPSGLRRFATSKPGGGRRMGKLRPDAAAAVEGRSIFSRFVQHASEVARVLKSGHNSRKIGKTVTKGPWRGFPIYTLTLKERRTCPTSCVEWLSCYGNNMRWAQRIEADEDLMVHLWIELHALQAEHPAGFVVRLHVLGDFYSADYARLWVAALDTFPALRVFGYTARSPFDEIGSILFAAAAARWDRFALRFSGAGFSTLCTEVVEAAADATGIICPAQTGGTDCCATCGLCWHSQRTISFLRH